MSKKRRTKMEIIREVLEILRARGGLNKTEIIYGAYLNYERASYIINWLIDKEDNKIQLRYLLLHGIAMCTIFFVFQKPM
jgi:predicted transcriptional regulator